MLAPLRPPGNPNSARSKPQRFFRFLIAFSSPILPFDACWAFFPVHLAARRGERISREIPTETSDKPPSKFIDFLSFPIAFSRTSVLVGGCLRPRVLQPHTVEQCRHASLRRFHGSEPNKKRPVALKKLFTIAKSIKVFQSSIFCSRKWKIFLRTLPADKTAFSLECLSIRISRALCLLFAARVRTKSRRPSLIPRRRNFYSHLTRPSTNRKPLLVSRNVRKCETRGEVWQRGKDGEENRTEKKLSARNCPPNDPIKYFFSVAMGFSLPPAPTDSILSFVFSNVSKRVQPGGD